MSPTVSRIMLSFAMVFASIVGYPLVLMAIDDMMGSRWAFREWVYIAMPPVFCLSFATGWLLIWSPQVNWTRRRVTGTITAAFLSLSVAGSLVAMLFWWQHYMEPTGGMLLGMFSWLTLWIALTAIVWRDSVGEQVKRWSRVTVATVRCQSCGYDMAGLRDPRCPECGRAYTLDELLVGSSRGRVDVE